MSHAADGPSHGAWTIEDLIAAERRHARLEYLFFWGHTPPRDGPIGSYVLSQWFEHPFNHEGLSYPTAEHFMMAEKARLFGDRDILPEILRADDPKAVKALGRNVRGFSEDIWNQHRLDIVTRGSIAKFNSTRPLRDYLIGTGSQILVEASPTDRIWGIGMDRTDPAASQPSLWRGLNLLGFALMAAREQLRSANS